MSRDASVYKDPDDFKPERFLGLSPEVLEQMDPSNYVFGHGRRCALFKTSQQRLTGRLCIAMTRICPGRALGDSSAWLVVAGIAACFDIKKARDAAGREITPPPDFLPGFTRSVPTRVGIHSTQ